MTVTVMLAVFAVVRCTLRVTVAALVSGVRVGAGARGAVEAPGGGRGGAGPLVLAR